MRGQVGQGLHLNKPAGAVLIQLGVQIFWLVLKSPGVDRTISEITATAGPASSSRSPESSEILFRPAQEIWIGLPRPSDKPSVPPQKADKNTIPGRWNCDILVAFTATILIGGHML
jgi:hypothetical protein